MREGVRAYKIFTLKITRGRILNRWIIKKKWLFTFNLTLWRCPSVTFKNERKTRIQIKKEEKKISSSNCKRREMLSLSMKINQRKSVQLESLDGGGLICQVRLRLGVGGRESSMCIAATNIIEPLGVGFIDGRIIKGRKKRKGEEKKMMEKGECWEAQWWVYTYSCRTQPEDCKSLIKGLPLQWAGTTVRWSCSLAALSLWAMRRERAHCVLSIVSFQRQREQVREERALRCSCSRESLTFRCSLWCHTPESITHCAKGIISRQAASLLLLVAHAFAIDSIANTHTHNFNYFSCSFFLQRNCSASTVDFDLLWW